MCGRYTLRDVRQALEWLGVPVSSDWGPRYNIAPSQRILAYNGGREAGEVIWGILPRWEGAGSKLLTNARSESVREKRSFKPAIEHRRCLIPADGFYEWNRARGQPGQPYFFTVNGGQPFAIAGIWEKGEDLDRCCLLTTAANSLMATIHDRMPVIVRREDWDEWFADGPVGGADFARLIRPYDAGEMSALPVSTLANDARVDRPECCRPAQSGDPPPKLTIRRSTEKKDGGTQAIFEF